MSSSPLLTRTVFHLVGRRFTAKVRATQSSSGRGTVVLTIGAFNDNPILNVYATPEQARYLLTQWQEQLDNIDDITGEEESP